MKSAADRQAARRTRMREAGFVLTQYWVHADDQAQLSRYVSRLNARRAKRPDASRLGREAT